MQNPVGQFEIYVSDIERATNFYEKVLGVKLAKLDPPNTGDENCASSEVKMMVFPEGGMDKYGANGSLVQVAKDMMPVGQTSVLIYFSCIDCAIEEARIKNAGGEVQQSKFSIGEHGFITLANDSEGNMFGLHSLK